MQTIDEKRIVIKVKKTKYDFIFLNFFLHLERVHDYYQKHLVERIYSNWKQALTRKLLIQQHQHRLAQLQEKVLMRWAFERWKSC